MLPAYGTMSSFDQGFYFPYNTMTAYGTPPVQPKFEYSMAAHKSESGSPSEDSSPTSIKHMTPDQYQRYKDKRARNNEAAKKSRVNRKNRENELSHSLKMAQEEIKVLKQRIMELELLWANQPAPNGQDQHEMPLMNNENFPPHIQMQFGVSFKGQS